MASFRIFYTSDIHGSERCLLKFANAAKFYQANAVILGGDVTGKVMVPLVKDERGYAYSYLGQTERADTDDALLEAEKKIRLNGFYPYRCDVDEYEKIQSDTAYQTSLFEGLMARSVARWVDIVSERLKGTGASAYLMAGNDDIWDVDASFAGAAPPVHWHDGKALPLGDWTLVGCSVANPTPWTSPRELPEEDLYQRLRAPLQTTDARGRRLIFNFHVPPHQSGLDMAPLLRDDLSVVRSGGEAQMQPVGSTAVRRVIEEEEPLLSLHGHVHESRGVARIGPTLSVNPGSEYGEGTLRGALITLGPKGVLSQQLISG